MYNFVYALDHFVLNFNICYLDATVDIISKNSSLLSYEPMSLYVNVSVSRRQGLFLTQLGWSSQDSQSYAFFFTLSYSPIPRIKADLRNILLLLAPAWETLYQVILVFIQPLFIFIHFIGSCLLLKAQPYMAHCFIFQMKAIPYSDGRSPSSSRKTFPEHGSWNSILQARAYPSVIAIIVKNSCLYI